MPFREAICSYLRTARAVRCDPGQIMIVSGSQQALDITTRVLLDPGDEAWIEEPCYPLVRSLLLGSGCRPVPVPVDDEGLNVAAGVRLAPNARVAFVTPSHHYALGVTMSASRRFQLLEWSRRPPPGLSKTTTTANTASTRMPIPSLQGLDPSDRVIYIGTFSKVLRPSLRLGYIVIPADLVDRFAAVRFSMDIFPSFLFQEALTDFMRDGHFARHIRRMRSLYKSRRAALVESLRAEFGDFLTIHGSEAGMHLTVTFPESFRAGVSDSARGGVADSARGGGSESASGPLSDVDIATRAAKEKLWLWPLSLCYTRQAPPGIPPRLRQYPRRPDAPGRPPPPPRPPTLTCPEAPQGLLPSRRQASARVLRNFASEVIDASPVCLHRFDSGRLCAGGLCANGLNPSEGSRWHPNVTGAGAGGVAQPL